jgi:HEAT repeat protein
MTRLTQLLSIKQGEDRTAFQVIGIMLFTSMGAALGGTGIEALFFARFGVEYLPYMYIGLGVTSMLTSFVIIGALGRISRKALYIAVPLLMAALIIGARLALLTGLNALYPALWLGKEILNSVIALVIWGLAGAVFDARQAKRLFPLFNASRIFGQVVGGFITGALVTVIGAENLLIVWAGLSFLTFLLIRALLGRQSISSATPARSRRKQPALLDEMGRGYRYVRGSSLLTWISFSTILFSILYFSIALPFSRAATEQFPDENSLAAFLGLFNGFSTAAAFLVSLFLANRLFARIGIMACILLLPMIYLVGFGGLALAPLFVVIVAFRFIQMLWLAGIADPAWQAMFNVVPPERRDQVRTFMDVPAQAGTFLAGGILVLGEQTLEPQHLYFIGLIAAAVCAYVIYRARHGYNLSLVEALRAGRPHLFFSEEKPFGGFQQDSTAADTALNGLHDPDPIVRRISAEIVGHFSLPESTHALVDGLSDVDPLVRAACLRALTHSKATPALLDIASSLSDSEPDVRYEAVSSLTILSPTSPTLTKYLIPLLDDKQAKVSVRAALSLLILPSPKEERGSDMGDRAKKHLRNAAVFGNLEERTYAITALGEWGDRDAFDFLANEFRERHSAPDIKRAILYSLTKIDQEKAIPLLLESLRDPYVRATSAQLLGDIGDPAMAAVLAALDDEASVEGALLALEHLPLPPSGPILNFARMAVSRAGEYDALMRGTSSQVPNDAMRLLAESLQDKSHQYGIRALRAIGLLGDREAMNLAVENLQLRDASQKANVMESLDSISAKWRDVIQPLMKLWEDETPQQETINWERLLVDDDPWICECAQYAAHQLGVKTMENLATLSLMERILFLKRVPLFADLSPVDLKQAASIADEELFSDGEEIAHEGDEGDVMFVIVSGEVRVCTQRDGREIEIARRKAGDYVGEMAVIGREPRTASLIAVDEVRTLCIDQKSFEALLRDRPDVSLNVIKELARRLKEASEKIKS